jgi:tRNA-2-methylthio-N6-dimethylallyladenosine synthase
MKGLFVQTYGCQMNVSDSERMKAVLAPLGYKNVNRPEEADLVLINTCSIREKAEDKMGSFAHNVKNLKKDNPRMLLGVTGCVAQQEKESIQRDFPFVDLVLGPDNIDELPWALEELRSHPKEHVLRTEFDNGSRVWNTTAKVLNPGPSTFLSVMKGCDHFCSYCIVPWTRGREKSRPIKDIITDVRSFVDQGVREITFLGQNINTFGKRAGESLEELFYAASDVEGLKRIRFTTSHPGDLKDSLIDCFKDLPKLCSYFHLPVQSGSNRILKMMRRFYTTEEYLEKIEKLRAVRPDIAFSGDFIVGFPGETEEDFEKTLQLIERVGYDNLYSFVFSPRPGTSAASREDTTPANIKLERLDRLQNLARTISRKRHEQEVGKIHEILIEGSSKKDAGKWTGRNSQNVPVHITKEPGLNIGDLVNVRVIEGTLTHLNAEALVTDEPAFSLAMNQSAR